MATYIVGDLHGCLSPLLSLLEQVKFDLNHDKLWLTGDLVARGPESLETLRFIKTLGNNAQTVLGNHDLHLLAVAYGLHDYKSKDNLDALLNAPDREQLLDWLRIQPLFVEHPEHPFVITHAGIPPQWDLAQTRDQSQQVQKHLVGLDYLKLLKEMYNDEINHWHNGLTQKEQMIYTINALTRMRFCQFNGDLDLKDKSEPIKVINNIDSNSTAHMMNSDTEVTWKHAKHELIPWFCFPRRQFINKKIIFGHWASLLGYKSNDIIGVDTGYVWGHSLTMLRWEDQCYFSKDA